MPRRALESMRTRSTKESARTLPREWIEENWGIIADAPRVVTHHNYADPARIPAGRHRRIRPRTAPAARREDNAGRENRAHAGRRMSHKTVQHQHPQSSIRLVKADAGGDSEGVLLDSWGRGGGPSFAPRGVGPTLEPPRPPKGPTRPRWPTRSVEASVLRYIRTVHQEKVLQGKISPAHKTGRRPTLQGVEVQDNERQSADRPGTFPTVAWPEHAGMEKGDVVVTVEHCHSCHRHRMTTRHDSEVYLRHANAVKELLIESLREAPVRLAVILKKAPLRARPSSRGGRECSATANSRRDRRVGAFEIQVAARHPSQAHALHAQVLHSKLASGRWPRMGADTPLIRRAMTALESWGFEARKRPVDGAEMDADGNGADDALLSCPQRRRPARIPIPWEFDHRKRGLIRNPTGSGPQDARRDHRTSEKTSATSNSPSLCREGRRHGEELRNADNTVGTASATAAKVMKCGTHEENALLARGSAAGFEEDTEATAQETTSASPGRGSAKPPPGGDGTCDVENDCCFGAGDEDVAKSMRREIEGEAFEECPLAAATRAKDSTCAPDTTADAGTAARSGCNVATARADVASWQGGEGATSLERRLEGERNDSRRDDSENDESLATPTEMEEGEKRRRPTRNSEDVLEANDYAESTSTRSRSGSSTVEGQESGSNQGSPRNMADEAERETMTAYGRGEHAQSTSESEGNRDHGLSVCARQLEVGSTISDSCAKAKGADGLGHEGDGSWCQDDKDSGSGRGDDNSSAEATAEQDRVGSTHSHGCNGATSPRSSGSGRGGDGGYERGVDNSMREEKQGNRQDDLGTIADEYESDFGSQGEDSSVEDDVAGRAAVQASLAARPLASLQGTTDNSVRLDCEDLQVMDGRAQDEEDEEEYGEDFDDDNGDF